MGVHPGPSVVRAKGFLTGDNQRRDYKGARDCGAHRSDRS
jgi:hypothetical protein